MTIKITGIYPLYICACAYVYVCVCVYPNVCQINIYKTSPPYPHVPCSWIKPTIKTSGKKSFIIHKQYYTTTIYIYIYILPGIIHHLEMKLNGVFA